MKKKKSAPNFLEAFRAAKAGKKQPKAQKFARAFSKGK